MPIDERGRGPGPAATIIDAGGWRIRRSDVTSRGQLVCVPTVHPRGDQRVLRCAQSLLDAGFAVHLIWMGGVKGTTKWSPRLTETRISAARSTWDRVRALPGLARRATRDRPAAWHIHDFYMLPCALAWHLLTRRPVIYDVHEFYAPLYATKFPERLRGVSARCVDRFQGWAARRLGGVNLVAESMREPFEHSRVLICVTPNYPSRALFDDLQAASADQRRERVVHAGSLSEAYGSEVLIEVARLLAAETSSTQIIAIKRFHSTHSRRAFERSLARAGNPANLVLIDPMPAHGIPGLLATCGIGLSLIQDHGQNRRAVPSKLYEYTLAGLPVVASDLDEQRLFIRQHSSGQVVDPGNPHAYVRAIKDLQSGWDEAQRRARLLADQAKHTLTWEGSCSPRLQRLATELIQWE